MVFMPKCFNQLHWKYWGNLLPLPIVREIGAHTLLLTLLIEYLVYIHTNLPLLERGTPKYSRGETKAWDIAGVSFDSFEDVGMLEVANLSLDEPELEGGVLEDHGGGESDNDVVDHDDVMEI